MSEKKLYEVTVELTTFVMATDEYSAAEIGADAFVDEGISGRDCDAREVKHKDIALDGRWDHDCLERLQKGEMKMGMRYVQIYDEDDDGTSWIYHTDAPNRAIETAIITVKKECGREYDINDLEKLIDKFGYWFEPCAPEISAIFNF